MGQPSVAPRQQLIRQQVENDPFRKVRIFMSRYSMLLAVTLALIPLLASAQTEQHPVAVTIACRVLETHADPELKVAAILFHQRDAAQRSELAMLLRNYSGQMVQIQGNDGGWRDARMVRLKSCFGRGLLLLAAPSPISEHSQFLLRVPGGAAATQDHP